MTDDLLLWLDLETTGLDLDGDDILEIGAVVTRGLDAELDSFQRIVRPPDFNPMNLPPEVFHMHMASGLIGEMMTGAVTERDAVVGFRTFLDGHFGEEGEPIVVGGSGIDRFDLPLMRNRGMWVRAANRFHWRTIDVSGLKQVASFAGFPLPDVRVGHRALDDARWAFEVARSVRGGLSAAAIFDHSVEF